MVEVWFFEEYDEALLMWSVTCSSIKWISSADSTVGFAPTFWLLAFSLSEVGEPCTVWISLTRRGRESKEWWALLNTVSTAVSEVCKINSIVNWQMQDETYHLCWNQETVPYQPLTPQWSVLAALLALTHPWEWPFIRLSATQNRDVIVAWISMSPSTLQTSIFVLSVMFCR